MDVALPPVESIDLPRAVERLRGTGVRSGRLLSPDLAAQLEHSLLRPIDTVICVAIDLDPRVALQSWVLRQSPGRIVDAALRIARLLGDATAVLVADLAMEKELARLPAARDRRLRITPVDNVYPLADPTLLLRALLRRSLLPGRPSTDAGVLMLDAVTAEAAANAWASPTQACVAGDAQGGKPSTDAEKSDLSAAAERMADYLTPVAVCDYEGASTRIIRCDPAAPVAGVLDTHCPGWHGRPLFEGALARGVAVGPQTAVGQTELVIHVMPRRTAHATLRSPEPCTRCGACAAICPTRLQPASLLEAAQHADAESAGRYGIDACLGCGLCDAVCPCALPILAGIRTLAPGNGRAK